jgi:hypothetical protein
LFSYDRSAVAEALPRVGCAKQSVAFRRTGMMVEGSIIHREWLCSQRPQILLKVTPPSVSAFSFYIKSNERKSAA